MSSLSILAKWCLEQVVNTRLTYLHGPRNLYDRDGKFRPTFKSGMENPSIFRLTFDDLMSTKCTKLQICTYIFKKFPRLTPSDPQNCEGSLPRLPTRQALTVPLFQSFRGHCLPRTSITLTTLLFIPCQCPAAAAVPVQVSLQTRLHVSRVSWDVAAVPHVSQDTRPTNPSLQTLSRVLTPSLYTLKHHHFSITSLYGLYRGKKIHIDRCSNSYHDIVIS